MAGGMGHRCTVIYQTQELVLDVHLHAGTRTVAAIQRLCDELRHGVDLGVNVHIGLADLHGSGDFLELLLES